MSYANSLIQTYRYPSLDGVRYSESFSICCKFRKTNSKEKNWVYMKKKFIYTQKQAPNGLNWGYMNRKIVYPQKQAPNRQNWGYTKK